MRFLTRACVLSALLASIGITLAILWPQGRSAHPSYFQIAVQFEVGISAICLAFFLGFRASEASHAKVFEESVEQALLLNLKQLGSQLPVGFFLAAGAEIYQTNGAWDDLVGRRVGEGAVDAIERTGYLQDAQSEREILQRASEQGQSGQIVVRHAGGKDAMRYLKTFVASLSDRSPNVVGITLDVTDQIQADALAERQRREHETVQRLLRLSMAEMNTSIEALVKVLVRAVEAKDPYTAGHSERVTDYAVLIGERMGLNFHDLRTLEIGCLVHDIGKIGVPDTLLTKPCALTDEEYELVAGHAALGSEILAGLPLFRECLPIVRHHHERLDGTGYPDGLNGDEIPLIVRIAMVADSFDAMTSTRAYRQGMHPAIAIKELQTDADHGRLDPVVVAIFADMVKKEGLPGRLTASRPRPSTRLTGELDLEGSTSTSIFYDAENAA